MPLLRGHDFTTRTLTRSVRSSKAPGSIETALDSRVAELSIPLTGGGCAPALSMAPQRRVVLSGRPLAASARRELTRQLHEEGYARTPPVVPAPLAGRMFRCIATLKKHGWPPVFALVVRRVREIWRTRSLVALLKDALGEELPADSPQSGATTSIRSEEPGAGRRTPTPSAGRASRSGFPCPTRRSTTAASTVVPKNLMTGRAEAQRLFDAADVPLATVTELLQ